MKRSGNEKKPFLDCYVNGDGGVFRQHALKKNRQERNIEQIMGSHLCDIVDVLDKGHWLKYVPHWGAYVWKKTREKSIADTIAK